MAFTDPISGDSYGAIAERCGDVSGGAVGLCEPCADFDASNTCAGYTGALGGAYCQPINDGDDQWFCLIDCTDTDEFCPDGTACNEAGNCVPDTDRGESCLALSGECSDGNHLGSCDEGLTCEEGACLPQATQSAQCRYNLTRNTGAAQMVLRGQELAQGYDDALAAYWGDDGSDPERELQFSREYSNSRYLLNNHIEKINTIRAVFDIFGKVY
jgi:hypothetical protein